MHRKIYSVLLQISIFALFITACGGGGGSSTSASNNDSSSLSSSSSSTGVAAVGAALPGSTITILDKDGTLHTATADSDGTYDFPASVQGPVLLRAVGNAGTKTFTLYSAFPIVPGQTKYEQNGEIIDLTTLETEDGNKFEPISQININPITDAIVRKGLGGSTAIENKFTAKQTISEEEGMDIIDALFDVGEKLAYLTSSIGLMSKDEFNNDANPFISPMEADHTSDLDVLLDTFKVYYDGIKIQVKSKFPLPSGVLDGGDGIMEFDDLDSLGDDPFGSGLNNDVESEFEAFQTAIASMNIEYLIYGCSNGSGSYTIVCSVGTNSGDDIIGWDGSEWVPGLSDTEFESGYSDPEGSFCSDHSCE